ncbi:MAG TPA: LysR substrate-binding domain-containing protein [Candidatus Lumbricidophila sp.]|nr:LysR substrate-binding domain-containing protein [Candidatus Lumbricidophila sp.]
MPHEQSPLRLAYVAGVSPARWLRAWSERRPDVPLIATRVEQRHQTADLESGDADIAFVRLPVDRDGLHVIPLWEELAVAVLPKGHPGFPDDPESITLVELADLPVAPVQDDSAMTVELVAAGTGYAIMPHGLARLHHRRDVVAVSISDAPPTQIALAWRVERDDADVQEFVGLVRGRGARSSRGAGDEPGGESAKPSKAAVAKAAAAKARAEAAAKAGGAKSGAKSGKALPPGLRPPRKPSSAKRGRPSRGRGR